MNVHRFVLWAVIAVVGCFGHGKSMRALAADQENQQFQGEWTVVSMELYGRKSPPQVLRGYRLAVEGNVFALEVDTRKVHWSYRVDATKSPKQIDLFAMQNGKKVNLPGIYEFRNNTLTICRALTPDGRRPTHFVAENGVPTSLIVWKRKKSSE